MNIKTVYFALSILFTLFSSASFAEDKGKKGYWISAYDEVRETPLAVRAQRVFKRVLSASDRRAGVEPALYIINFDGTPWAQSLADGSIILSKKGLEFCYNTRSAEDGDSRLAFVVGHELAHQFNGDFWQYKFLRTAGDAGKNIQAFQDIKEMAKNPDMLLARELQADQYGVIYAASAGYDTDKIISGDKNFFLEWAEKETPSGKLTDNLRAFSAKRAKVVSMRLKEVADRIALFDLGVISYQIGRFDDALTLFERFASYFPGREVYANIGTIHLRLAYEMFRSARTPESFPFALLFSLDKKTRAGSIDIARGFTEDRYKAYNEALRIAVESLKKAVEYDPFYKEAKNNLGCAYIIENKYYDAVSILEEALKSDPENPVVQNNLGAAYILLGQSIESRDLIAKAGKVLKAAKDKNKKAKVNWSVFQRIYDEEDGAALVPDIAEEPFQDLIIESASSREVKPGRELANKKGFSLVEEISSGKDKEALRVYYYNKENGKMFLLAKGSKISLVLYKEPSNLRTDIKGGDNKEIYISGSGRNGIVFSKDKAPDYFEF
ncbi:MAG: hypothetical protein HZA14_07390 [Nitrospirae bacterium]|nr:hypothetical protein [Nitrospirota bacterium]